MSIFKVEMRRIGVVDDLGVRIPSSHKSHSFNN